MSSVSELTRKRPLSLAKLQFRMANAATDIPALIELAREAHTESRFGYIPFSEAKVRKIVATALKDEKRHGIMVVLRGDDLVGAASCSVGEFHIGTGVLLTTIHNINVKRKERASLSGGRVALGLFKGIETWSKARGAEEILFHVTSGVDLARIHKLAKRMGYQFVGGSYAKSVT
jgi:hypothetical protein